jgi:hypothetical protein
MTYWRRRPVMSEYGPTVVTAIGVAVIVIGLVWQIASWMN